MSWADERALWLLLVIPVLVGGYIWASRRRARATREFGVSSTLAPLIVGKSYGWRVLRAALLTLGLTLLILALAGPQYGSRTRVLRKRGIDVVIALDFSKSMLAQDVRPSRIRRAKGELERLLDDLDGNRIGLVAFAGDTIAFPMTVDRSAIRLFLRDLTPADMPYGGTAIGKALIASKRLIESSSTAEGEAPETNRRARVVILLTDGEDHEGDPMAAAEELRTAGIEVYTVGIGSRRGEPIPTYAADGTLTGHMKDSGGNLIMTALSADNEQTLEDIADVTGGEYFRARDGTVGVDQIRLALSQLQASEQKARRVTVHENRFALVLLPAFLLLVLEGLLPDAWVVRRRRRMP